MNKDAFLQRLSVLLSDLSLNEREEALQYYRDYIEDAGIENEAAVLQELGSPEKLANDIKQGLGFTPNSNSFSENQSTQQTGNSTYQQVPPAKNKLTPTQIALIILAAILLSPVWVSVLSTILSAILTIILSIVAIIIVFGALGIAFILAFISLIIVGIVHLYSAPAASFLLIGIGFLLGGLGIFSLLLCIVICSRFLPWTIRNIVALCKKPFANRKENVL